MPSTVATDNRTGRKFFLDDPDDLRDDEPFVFLLNLHGGGSHGTWQHLYFPAHDYKEKYRLVVATPSAATRDPRRWVGEADDDHLQAIVDHVIDKYGKDRIRAFWLVGHSQGGMTSNRLLNTEYFADRVDGWLSLSGGRIGAAPRSATAGAPMPPGTEPRPRMNLTRPPVPDCDFSHIFAVGEYEIESLPESSPWAEKYGAGARVRQPDVVDTEPGQIFDQSRDGYSTRAWGLKPAPGTAEIYVYPNARDGRVIADVVRLNKGHTEGLEPKVTEAIIELLVQEPGGKIRNL
ncbi:MAG TPA: alpha/beta fold hydrolase [Pseudomonadales bacterium]|nr:alpha/beta fold hydrolase [Pseudomonadales bacterium]